MLSACSGRVRPNCNVKQITEFHRESNSISLQVSLKSFSKIQFPQKSRVRPDSGHNCMGGYGLTSVIITMRGHFNSISIIMVR